MKKMVLLAAIMLMGVIQNVNAQNDAEYSLEGIGKTLNGLASTSKEVFLGDFHEGLAWVRVWDGKDNYKFGFIDKFGKLVVPIMYSDADNFSEGLASVSNGGSHGFIDKNGTVVIPFTIEGEVGRFSEGFVTVTGGGKVGYLDKSGKKHFEVEVGDKRFECDFHGNLAPIPSDKKMHSYFINKKGEIVKPESPFQCNGFVDGYFILQSREGVGAMDISGNIVISPSKYGGIRGFSDGLFVAKKGFNSVGFVNTKGEEAIPFKFKDARTFSEGLAAVKTDDGWGYINKQGEVVIKFQFEEAYNFNKGLALVRISEGYAVIDKQGNTVSPIIKNAFVNGTFHEGLSLMKQNGKWGYVDVYGNSTLNPNVMGNTKP